MLPIMESLHVGGSGTYVSLVRGNLVMPSGPSDPVTIDREFLIEIMQGLVQNIFIDEDWYLATYKDVRAAIDSGLFKNAVEHYTRFGYFENSMPYRITVDEAWYRTTYPDIQAAIDDLLCGSEQEHFDETGFSEGRLPYPGFTLKPVQPAANAAAPSPAPRRKKASASA